MAGEIGANVLTNLLGQTAEEVAGKISAYRKSRRENGHSGKGKVTLMLHTFVGPDLEEVHQKVRKPFTDYLKTSTDLVRQARWEFPAFATAPDRSLVPFDSSDLSAEELQVIMDHAFHRYFQTSGMFGTPDMCLQMVARLKEIGVDEIACLIDFGVDTDSVLESLQYLNQVRERSNPAEQQSPYSIAAQIRRHQVTHLQCTPSLASVLASDPDSLAALRPLRKLLLGGEALPPSLAAQLAPAIDGDLINMYGPTETTVWSTAAPIDRSGSPITIGRPIANTQTYIVDRHLRLAPVGAAGELLIGGDSVARGYLNRPDLTNERFIADPYGERPGARLYRTGDLARYGEHGELEFLGRLDHQVKISGYRIEPGEIEAVLGRHPAVRESVAVVRESGNANRRLIAYVAARGAADPAEPNTGMTAEWRDIWNETYNLAARSPEGPPDPTLNTAGWISSYTGEAIPEGEMREWVEHTVDRIIALKPRRILEIGCGTGMLLFRIVPHCQHYHAVDFSANAVRYVQEEVRRQGLDNVQVECAAGDELPGLEPGSFDLVVLNSVIQYFPSVEYLVKVMERVAPLVADGGAIFAGDVRSFPLLEAFHTSVELEQSPDNLSAIDLSHRIRRRLEGEKELTLSPDFFHAIQGHIPRIRRAEIMLKRGRRHNEMTCFRYDAVLRLGGPVPAAPTPVAVSGSKLSLQQIRERLAAGKRAVSFRGIPNPRVAQAVRAVEILASDECPPTAGQIRLKLSSLQETGVAPEELYALDTAYDAHLTWSAEELHCYDAVFFDRFADSSEAQAPPAAAEPRKPWIDYANPRDAQAAYSSLARELKDLAKRRLPEYMVPSAIIVLDALPRTPNGKIDRQALPEPDREWIRPAAVYSAPQGELEKSIAAVWRDLLRLERIGANDNFFDLGADSLLMLRANMRLRELLQQDLSLVDLFRYPTISALASHLSRTTDDQVALDQSQQRGQSRIDALQRRRLAPIK